LYTPCGRRRGADLVQDVFFTGRKWLAGIHAALTILDFAPTQDVRERDGLDAVFARVRPKGAGTERARGSERLASLVPPRL
jgi:hypothetical protein